MHFKIYKPFDVVVLPFPFTDLPIHKKRPVLVISSTVHQKETGHLTVLMITSAEHSHWPSDHLLFDLENTGLHKACLVRQKIFSVDSRLVLSQIGHISEQDQRAVEARLKAHLSRA